MKQYFLNVAVIVMAVALTAYNPEKNQVTVKVAFDFMNASVFNQWEVAKASNWKENIISPVCNGTNAACAFEIDPNKLIGASPNRVVDGSMVTISTTGNNLTGYAPTGGPGISSITNMP